MRTVVNPLQARSAAGALESLEAGSRSTGAVPCRPIVVLGIGNTLLTDDGAGVGVVSLLQGADDLPDVASLVDGGTLSFSLLADITDADSLIVVDAVDMKAAPGSVQCFVGDEMDRFLARGGHCSVHEVGLTELFGMARLQDRLPERRALVAIQPARIEWGAELSGPVAAVLPQAADRVRALVRAWSG